MSRLRVLHVLKSLGLGGTEKTAQLFMRHLDSARFDKAVHCPVDGPRAAFIREDGGASFIGVPLEKALSAFRPHIVHLHRAGWPEPEYLRPVRDYARRNPLAVVETNVFGRHDPSPMGALVDLRLFVSNFCAERYARHTGVDVSGPGHGVLYNPVDTDFYAAALPGGADCSRPVLGRISRADPGKWARLALDILPVLAARVPGFRCRIVGGVPQAEDFVRAQGLEGCVAFLPPIATEAGLAEFYGGCAVLAHANDTGESFGLVIAEAMACGLPVVTHPCPGDRDNAQLELVEHGVTGFVAEDAPQYAEAVTRLFADPELARRMGRAGREKAARLYRAQDIGARLTELYLELLARKGMKADA